MPYKFNIIASYNNNQIYLSKTINSLNSSFADLFNEVIDSNSNNINKTLDGIKLSSPIISMLSGTLSWNAVTNATNYELFVNDTLTRTLSTTSIVISTLELDPGEYTLKVRATSTNQYESSDFSNEVIYNAASFGIQNPLNGGTLSAPGYGANQLYQYLYTGGTPDSIGLIVNGGSEVSITTTQTINVDGNYASLTVDINGNIESYGNPSTLSISGVSTANCTIKFYKDSTFVEDTFTAFIPYDVCFIANTLVKTPKGFEKIQNIKEGDLVLSYNAITGEAVFDKVISTNIQNGQLRIIQINLEDGSHIGTTPSHKFLTENGWLSIDDGLEYHSIKTIDNTYVAVIDYEYLEVQPLYHIELETNDSYFITDSEEHSLKLGEHFKINKSNILLRFPGYGDNDWH